MSADRDRGIRRQKQKRAKAAKKAGMQIREFQSSVWVALPDFLREQAAKAAKAGNLEEETALLKAAKSVTDSRTFRATLALPKYRSVLSDIQKVLTPKRRGALLKQVAEDVKGTTLFGPDYKALVTFYRTGDVSTLFHEGAHVLRRFLGPDDLRILEQHYGVPPAGPVAPSQYASEGRVVTSAERDAIRARGQAFLRSLATADRRPLSALEGDKLGKVQQATWDAVQRDWGGATIDPTTGRAINSKADVYSVTVRPHGVDSVAVPIEGLTRDAWDNAVAEARVRFGDILSQKGHYLGAFRDPEVGRVELDPVVVVNNAKRAEEIAAFTGSEGGAYHFKSGNGLFAPRRDPKEVAFETGGRWTPQMEERFAFDAERYMSGRIPPAPEVQGVFRRLFDGLARTWTALRGHARAKQIVSDPMANFFDRIFGGMDRTPAGVPGRPSALPPALDSALAAQAVQRTASTGVTGAEEAALVPAQAAAEQAAAVGTTVDQAITTPHPGDTPEIAAARQAAGAGPEIPAAQLQAASAEREAQVANQARAQAQVAVENAPAHVSPGKESFPLQVSEVAARPYEAVPADATAAKQHEFNLNPELAGKITGSSVDASGEIVHKVEEGNWAAAKTDAERIQKMGRVIEVRNTVLNPEPELGRGVFIKIQNEVGQVQNFMLRTPRAHLLQETRQVALAAMKGIDDPRRLELANAYLGQLEEPISQELRVQLGGHAVSDSEHAMENLRTFVASQLEQDMLLRHGFTPDQLLENAYLPQRMASGAHYDSKLNECVDGTDTLDLHRARQQAGLAIPMYFPKYDARQMRYSDLLLSRRLVGAVKRAENPDYLKRNKGFLLARGLYNRDPVEAYGRRAAVALKSREQFELYHQVIQRFGRRIKNPGDYIPGAEVLTSPELLLRYFRNQVTFQDAVLDGVFAGEKLDDAAAKAMRQIATDSIDEIAQRLGVTSEELGRRIVSDTIGVTRNGIELYALPKTVAERFMRSAGHSGSRTARLFFQKPLQVWRAWTLNGSPRWLINNAVSNVAALKLQGGRLMDVVRQFDPKFRAMLDTVVPEEANLGFHSGYEYQPRLGSAAESFAGRLAEATAQTRPITALRRARDFMGRLNAGIEDAFRRASYLKGVDRATSKATLRRTGTSFWNAKSKLEDIALRGVDPRIAEAATTEMNRFFGDFSKMSPVEKNVIRPYIAPFWGWYRHMARMVLTLPFEYPGKAQLLRLWATAGNEMNDQYGALPDWMQGAAIIGQDSAGSTKYLSTLGANPFATVSQMLDPSQALTMLNPIVKTAYEEAMGRDVFGNAFTDPNVVTPPFGQSWRVDPQTGAAAPAGNVAPGLLENILRNFPQYQTLENVLGGGAATYGTANLPTLLGGALSGSHAGVVTDAAGNVKYPGNAGFDIANILGLPIHEMNLPDWQLKQMQEQLYAQAQWARAHPQEVPQ
jgi:hypothetical protein